MAVLYELHLRLFAGVIGLSVWANVMICAILILRLVRVIPKQTRLFAWAITAFTLIFPLRICLPDNLYTAIPEKAVSTLTPPLADMASTVITNPLLAYRSTERLGESLPHFSGADIFFPIASFIWLAGVITFLTVSIIRYVRLRRRVAASVSLYDEVMICDDIDTPFVLGIFRPKIYLPSDLTEEQTRYVVFHERAHIRALDHIWKLISAVLCSVYWFDILVISANKLFMCDIEYARDQAAYRWMKPDDRLGYAHTLLDLSTEKAFPGLAFCETEIKGRIEAVASYRESNTFEKVLGILVASVLFITGVLSPFFPATYDDVRFSDSAIIRDPEYATVSEDGCTTGTESLDNFIKKSLGETDCTFITYELLDAYVDGEDRILCLYACAVTAERQNGRTRVASSREGAASLTYRVTSDGYIPGEVWFPESTADSRPMRDRFTFAALLRYHYFTQNGRAKSLWNHAVSLSYEYLP